MILDWSWENISAIYRMSWSFINTAIKWHVLQRISATLCWSLSLLLDSCFTVPFFYSMCLAVSMCTHKVTGKPSVINKRLLLPQVLEVRKDISLKFLVGQHCFTTQQRADRLKLFRWCLQILFSATFVLGRMISVGSFNTKPLYLKTKRAREQQKDEWGCNSETSKRDGDRRHHFTLGTAFPAINQTPFSCHTSYIMWERDWQPDYEPRINGFHVCVCVCVWLYLDDAWQKVDLYQELRCSLVTSCFHVPRGAQEITLFEERKTIMKMRTEKGGNEGRKNT